MATHMTVRMAWHDNNWNGRVCLKPEDNVYCVGTHSLLSDRLARNKNVNVEEKHKDKPIEKIENYLPPCFWTTNAFSGRTIHVRHDHPFGNLKEKTIQDELPAFSVFTWPFRLSFNHDKAKHRRHGNYPPDLRDRIETFVAKFKPNQSIVFFYVNYDNPVSADENRYVLVGCAPLAGVELPKEFPFGKEELAKWRRKTNMQHFPVINWAVKPSYDFMNSGVILPYKEYLDYVDEHPESEELLTEMRVLIEEEALIPSFKYVANDIDDDRCIYLLSKLRKALTIIKKHGIVDLDNVSQQLKTIDSLLKRTWQTRGLYPSLGSILDIIADAEDENCKGNKVIALIRANLSPGKDLLEATFKLIEKDEQIPAYLDDYESFVEEARSNFAQYCKNLPYLKKMALFGLTPTQIKRILFNQDKPFKRRIGLAAIAENPYLLCEEYVAENPDLDNPEQTDSPIGIFKVDIGLFPDSRYLTRNRELQNLHPTSSQRLRALIIDYLRRIGEKGDCYARLDDMYEWLTSYPLFYKEELHLDKDALHEPDSEHLPHFKERLTIVRNKDEIFFYLNEVRAAEDLVKETVLELLGRSDHDFTISRLEEFVATERAKLENDIPAFHGEQFTRERIRLLNSVLNKSFYVISGKPGSGKTKVLKKIIDELHDKGEAVTLLAPTGKATLRLRNATGFKDTQTIDRYIYSCGCNDILEDLESLVFPTEKAKPHIENLIIDECSMVDLQRLVALLNMLKLKGTEAVHRVILVGDENQLPPIGYGKPYYDIIQFIKSKETCRENNYTELTVNCRQKFDENIIKVAELFVGKNRYYEELIEQLSSGKYSSQGFSVVLWTGKHDLYSKIEARLSGIIKEELESEGLAVPAEKPEQLNLLFGLYETGHVKQNDAGTMRLDRLQMLTPYRAGYFGTLGINKFVKDSYRKPHPFDWIPPPIPFTHSEKIMRISNWYRWDKTANRRELLLSNGSIGVVCNKVKEFSRWLFFPDAERTITWIDDEENFELAYVVTVHKSQGSEFKNVFLVLPNKSTLLSKELLYTALTRSTDRITLFLQEPPSDGESILEVARKRSFILPRMTSIFETPEDFKRIYEPRKGEPVKSKIEYIIYKALESSGLEFHYETPVPLNKGAAKVTIHPDFTIKAGERVYYWEHLGELDEKNYSTGWKERKELYSKNGFLEQLVTSDDLSGVKHEVVTRIIEDIKAGRLQDSPGNIFSGHHYRLYA